ncbi:MAG: hypothetical protein J0H74_31060 [Chitinophagaceae bacterium]|nr:hypothetical protein [Chitinophagaceae bacterium]
MDRLEHENIARCKRLIEEKLRFGNEHGEVRQRDLEYLADSIEERSGIKLSLSTLKRLWKKDYDKVPHPSTLQGLVSVLGYKDWQEFKQRETAAPEASSAEPEHKRYMRWNTWLLLPIAGAVAVACWLIAFRTGPSKKKPVINGSITFYGNKTVSQGVPNTIIFNYDVTHVDADSFFFQQSWNPLDRVKIDPGNHVYSNIYYFPGFHKAKLIANDSIIKRFRIHITTDGWFPLARYSFDDSRPIYLPKKNAVRDGVLHIARDDVAAAGVNMEKDVIESYYNIREFENTSSDSFSIETRIMCDSLQTVACPYFELVIVCEEHIYFVRMMGKGCERDIAIKMGEVVHDGINKDLSVLGRNLYQWQQLQIKVVNKKATIYLGDQPVYSMTYKNDFGKVMGLVYNFQGTGAIDYVRLKNGEGKIVYSYAS